MNDEYNPDRKLEELLLDLLDGEWDADKQRQLDELLRGDAAARAHYREMMAMHAMLDTEFSDASDLNEEALSAGSQAKRHMNRRLLFMSLAAAALLVVSVGAGLFFLINTHPGDRQPVAGSDPVEDSIAVVTRTIQPRWTGGAEQVLPGQLLGKQWIKLDAGVVQIEFQSGARVTLEGPAQLRLDSKAECYIQSGKLTVLAPPAAANFKVKSHVSEVTDLGTEFGLVVDQSGEMDVHVLDGQVEVAVKGTGDQSVARRKLFEQQAATVHPGQRKLEDIPFDQTVFEPIRATTLWRTQPLKIQFDCGSRAGVYSGSQSPAHATGDMYPHETHWNALVGDQSGRFLLADGNVAPHRIEVDLGHGKKGIDWNAEIDTVTGPQGHTRGVFDTALGRDAINPPSGAASGFLGLRLRGLPEGKYRVYVLGRTSLDHANWGNYLVEKAHLAAVGLNLTSIDAPQMPMAPLDDPNARKWVAGQTHVVTDVAVNSPEQYVTIITAKDREHSPTPAGGRAVILGVQILQLADGFDGRDV